MRKLIKNYFLCQRGSDWGLVIWARGGIHKQDSPSLVVLALDIPDILIDRE